jgi:hypothetical protein
MSDDRWGDTRRDRDALDRHLTRDPGGDDIGPWCGLEAEPVEGEPETCSCKRGDCPVCDDLEGWPNR